MSTLEIIESLKQLTTPERLAVIEAASRLIREEFCARPRIENVERSRQMREAALSVRNLYEAGGEITEWTCLDGEEVLDNYLAR